MPLAHALHSLLLTRRAMVACAASTATTQPRTVQLAWQYGAASSWTRPISHPQATYSSGAGSSDAVPPSNLPSGVMSSEASAADDDTIDAMPEEAFPAGAKRTPGPDETISTDAMRSSPDFPTSDQATDEGRTAAADPWGPNDASSVVAHPEGPQPEPLYPPSGSSSSDSKAEQQPLEPPHPSLGRKDPGGTRLS